MNSIESSSSPKLGAREGEASALASSSDSDPAALERLRAMLSGVATPPPGSGLPIQTLEGDTAGEPASLLTEALREQSLPPALVKILMALEKEASGVVALPAPDAGCAGIGIDQGVSAATADAASLAHMLLALAESSESDEVALSAQSLVKALTTPPSEAGAETTRDLLAESLVKALAARDEAPRRIEQEPNEASLGQNILQTLGGQSSTSAAQVAAADGLAPAPTLERVEQVSALMTEMADRVLVTDPVHGQAPEIRINVAENIMPGTEVRVWREDGGQLRVSFDTASPYWARVLNEASPMLAQRLSDRLPLLAPPQVIVQQQGGQPEDGRSRNRQTPWDLARESAEA